MEGVRQIGETGLLGIAPDWLPMLAFWLLLFALAAAELAWPFRAGRSATGPRLVANFGLGIINALLLSLLPLSVVIAAEWARAEGMGLLRGPAVPTAVLVVATLTIRSLANYGLHRLAHSVPLLWRMHQVHHSDNEVDLSTGLRHHPAELLYVAAVLGALSVLLGLSPGALAAYEIVAAGFALWTHANLRLPDRTDRTLGWLFVGPRFHHVHHSADRRRTDSNYGDIVTLWDRLFGTWCDLPAEEVARQRCGLGDRYDAGAGNLLVQLGSPLARPPRVDASG